MKNKTKSLTLAGVCLALCMILPFLTGQIPRIGNALSPMHIPVLICGFACGWPFGLIVGFIAPLLRSAIFGMPPMPTAITMAFEMATYGFVSGILYKYLPKKDLYIYPILIVAMIVGRVVWGVVKLFMSVNAATPFTWGLFIQGALITAVPGIVLHIVLVPMVVIALKRAGLITNEQHS